MQENWSLGRRKSCAVDILSCKKVETGEKTENGKEEDDTEKKNPRSQSLSVAFARKTHYSKVVLSLLLL